MKKIYIIGGGTSGWLTALVVKKFWDKSDVTLIQSSKIGILGAGEGSTPNFGGILSMIDISHEDFFHNTGATVKGGLNLINWTEPGSKAQHLFTGPQPDKFFPRYGYHFDARRVSDYFQRISLQRGIKLIDSEIESLEKDGENITKIFLGDKNHIDEIDFVFDCSGFSRIVTGKTHNEEWISYSDYLLINKAFGFFLPQNRKLGSNERTYTDMIAMNCGWMWKIELQHRLGCGYSFNGNYITVEEAKKEVEDYLGHEIKIQKVFDYNPGRFKKSWTGNSISIGLAYGFIEPLEATSLMTVIMQLKRLIDVEFSENFRDSYNLWCEEINDQNLMFIRYHYLNEKKDTKFWKDSYNMPIPDRLKKILDARNNLIPKTNSELIEALGLKETSENELTFQVYNYQMIFKKNERRLKKELI